MISETKNSNLNRVMPKFNRGFNEAIDQLGSRSIRINREKLAKILFKISYPVDDFIWENYSNLHKLYLDDADAIISQEKQLIEYQEEK